MELADKAEDDLAGLKSGFGLLIFAVPAQAPADQRLERRHQFAAPGRQPVGHLDGGAGDHVAGDYLRGAELPEPLGEHPVRQARHGRVDLGEPAGTARHGQQDGRAPPAADQLDRILEEPALVVVDVFPFRRHLLKISYLRMICKAVIGTGD